MRIGDDLELLPGAGDALPVRELVGGIPPADLAALPTPPPTRFRVVLDPLDPGATVAGDAA
jgi:hypothetical protein